jgi:hypothetical protein
MRLKRNGTDATCRRCGISPAKYWFSADVRFWHLADIPIALANVCFSANSGHRPDVMQLFANDPNATSARIFVVMQQGSYCRASL